MASELKDTLNLPKTDFAMKANLPQNEPKRLEFWKKLGIYQRIREARKDAQKYLLHDGPPYANGEIHLGHALNKSLKDFVVKSKTMAGFDAPTSRDGIATGCRSKSKSTRNLAARNLRWPLRKFAAFVANMRRSTSIFRASNSSASASLATSNIRIRRCRASTNP
jgi:isoleucyl-tRNA synthetase